MLILNFNPHTEWKRGFDVLFSLSVLIASSPLMLLISLLIKLEDGGAVIYRHKRITAAGKEFDCLKFRTMRVGAEHELEDLLENNPRLREEWEQTFKLKNDPRITRIGKLLRKTSLDELPQLLNVLCGDMSLVGPRPDVPAQEADYAPEDWTLRHRVRPGVTGLAQALKRSTATPAERTELDLRYVREQSLWLDLKILVRTLFVGFVNQNAY